MAAARFLVRGKVQGVFFCASARDRAGKLGLQGHAKNLADGRVDVLAVGDSERIDDFARWLRHGPPMARVEDVERVDIDEPDAITGFSIL